MTIRLEARQTLGALGVAVAGLALWMVGTNFFANIYNSAAQYHAALLFGGYLYGRRTASVAGMAYGTVLTFGVALAGWGLWQLYGTADARAHGPFVTPATFAATINLILLPAFVLVATGSRRPALLVILGVLAVALAASASRGGWLALSGAAALTLIFLRRAGLPIDRRALAVLGGSLVVGMLVVAVWSYATLGAQAAASFQSRLELYRLALAGIQPSTWLFGAGFGAFYYLLEAGRAFVPTYAGVTTYFVHNDYLQALYELGLPALAALLFIVIAPAVQSWRNLPQLPERDRALAIGALAAILSMALHALVDFPFFVPACILLYGGALGVLDAKLQRPPPAVVTPLPGWQRGVRAATLTLVVWILAVPVVAEAGAAYAEMQWRKADAQRAAFWFEAARRVDARDWRYHWYAGQFWAAHAAANANSEAARRAELALAAAISANSREVRPLYSRIELHTGLRAVLAKPADGETLRGWAERAVTLAPADPIARGARERIFRQFPPR